MAKVEVRPSGQVFDIDENISLKDALKMNGVVVKSICGGIASCGQCIVKILSGEDHISPMEYKEIKLLGNIFHITKERLSCQVRVHGDIIVDVSSHLKGTVKVSQAQKNAAGVIRKKAADLVKEEFAPTEAPKVVEPQSQNSWEQPKDPMRPKKFGGNKRPRLFNYEESDYTKGNDSQKNNSKKDTDE